MTEDEKWMREAISEAEKGIGIAAPNPSVGALIVRDGKELSRGAPSKGGRPHAERSAIANLDSESASGATAYVTLEPCSTIGQTGACTEALIRTGVSRVVYGAEDPNPAHAGGAQKILENAGIVVTSGVLEAECRHLIRGFAMVQTKGRPWVIAKSAMSLDGRITRPPGEGQWLTGIEARAEVQQLRAEVDAIITSGETVRKDDPALTLRGDFIPQDKDQPWRVVLTKAGLEYGEFQLFNDAFSDRTLIFRNQGLEESLGNLAKNHGANTVLLESGGKLMGSFLDAGLIDEFVIYLAPMVTGGSEQAIGGKGVTSIGARLGLANSEIVQVGNDLRVRGVVDRSPRPMER